MNYITNDEFQNSYLQIALAKAKRISHLELLSNPIALDNAINELNSLVSRGIIEYDATKLAFLRVDGATINSTMSGFNLQLASFLNVSSSQLESYIDLNYSVGTDELYAANNSLANLVEELETLRGYRGLIDQYGQEGINFIKNDLSEEEAAILTTYQEILGQSDYAQSRELDHQYRTSFDEHTRVRQRKYNIAAISTVVATFILTALIVKWTEGC